MTTATIHAPDTFRSYFAELGNAARTFAAALFAAQERQFVAPEVVMPEDCERSRARTHMKLIRMANDYQDMQPSLAAELRQLAARG